MNTPKYLSQVKIQPLQIFSVVAITLAVVIYRVLQIGRRDPRMPAGPPTVPILGNFHQIPRSGLYSKYVVTASSRTLKLTKPLNLDFATGLKNMVRSSR